MKVSTYAKFRQVKITKTGKEIFNRKATLKAIKDHLEYLRQQIEEKSISYGEIAELQELKNFIDSGDVQLLQWAGVDENT